MSDGEKVLTSDKKINLLFTFAPNYNLDYSTMRRTVQEFTENFKKGGTQSKLEFNKSAIKYCIHNCLTKCKENSLVLIPKLGAGVNRAYITNNKEDSDEAFMELIQSVIDSNPKIKGKNLTIIYGTL